VQKISSLVLALCKLHNFCIDNASIGVACPDDEDILNIAVDGGIFLPRMDNNREFVWGCDSNVYSHKDRLNDLLDGVAHIDDHTRGQRRLYKADRDLPCFHVLYYFEEQALEHPAYSAQRLVEERMDLEDRGVM